MVDIKRQQKRALGRNCTKCGKKHYYERHLCATCYKLFASPNCKCRMCEKEFHETPWRIKYGRGKYCSKQCFNKDIAEQFIQTKCLQCKNLFTHNKLDKRKYCTYECSVKYRIGKPHIISEEGRIKHREALKARRGKSIKRVNLASYRTPEHREYCRQRRLKQKFLTSNTNIERLMKAEFDKLGLKYEQQYELGNTFLCDFGFPEYKIIVECDGEYWHNQKSNKMYDKLKEEYCKENGWQLIRFTDKAIHKAASTCATIVSNVIQNQLASMTGVRK